MIDSGRFEIGAPVICKDGPCGEVLRAVIDPATSAVTHLAVGPRHDRGTGRLVPFELVASSGARIELRCGRAQFDALRPALDAELLPGATQALVNQQAQVRTLAYYDIVAAGGLGSLMAGRRETQQSRTFDRVPAGEVDVRPGERVQATDGPIGVVRGLVINLADNHITHVLLDEGHLWGKKQVAIPMSAVERLENAVRVNLTKQQIEDLPPVDVELPS